MTSKKGSSQRSVIAETCKGRWEKLVLVEWIAGLVASSAAVYLQLVRMQHAGALWRDEVATLNAATAPTLAEMWARLSYEIMPGLSLLFIRAWSLICAGGTDFGLRVFGLLIGLCMIGALWINGRLCGYRIPFVSVSLIGFSPLFITTGASIRPYGLAIVLILITVGVIMKALQSAEPKWIAVAALASILSVQCSYGNVCLVFGACTGAIAFSAFRRDWKGMAAYASVFFAAALSLIPYLGPLSRVSEWAIVVQSPVTVGDLLGKLIHAAGSPEPFMSFIWLGSACLAYVLVRRAADQKSAKKFTGEMHGILFAYLALPISAAAYLFWLRISSYMTYPWHYLLLLAVTAVYLEVILSRFVKSWPARLFRVLVFALIVAIITLPAWYQVQVRQTNIDVVAKIITERAEPHDLIVLNPWYYGISFLRYYTGTVALMGVPPLGIVTASRYDLLKRKMTSENPLGSLIDQIAKTLRNGHQVWIIGGVHFPVKGQKLPRIPPAPQAGSWGNEVYAAVWSMQTADFLQACAAGVENITIKGSGPVSPYENVPIVLASGWIGK